MTGELDWQKRAACLDPAIDPDLFFPGQGGDTKPAKKICLGCPVREECLEYALDNGERFGIWGGKSVRERRNMRRSRRNNGDRGAA